MNPAFQGAIAPVITLLSGRDTIDTDGLARRVEHTCRSAAGRVPLLIGITKWAM